MDRSDFIKTLGLGSATLILPQWGITSRPVRIYDNYLRGLAHYGWKEAKDHLQEGVALRLVREPQNLYDRFAIQVWWQEHPLGYIPAYENIVPANMMDAGVSLHAVVSLCQPQRSIHECLAVAVFADLIRTEPGLILPEANTRADDAPDLYRTR